MRYGCNHVYVLMCSSLSRGEVSTHAFLNVNAVFHGCIKDHIVHCTAHGEFLTQRFAGKALSSTLVFGFATGPGTLRIVEIQNIIITKYMHWRRFIWAESCTIWFWKVEWAFHRIAAMLEIWPLYHRSPGSSSNKNIIPFWPERSRYPWDSFLVYFVK